MSEALPDAHPDSHDPTGETDDARDAVDATDPEPAGPATFDVRARAVETAVIVASVVALRVTGILLLVVPETPRDPAALLGPLVALVFDPNLLAWVALVAAVQFGFRRMPRPGRWTLVLIAAPVGVLLASALRSLPGLASAGFGAVLGNSLAWLDASILTILVGLALAFAAAVLGRERRTTATIAGALLALGGLLTLVLAWQAFETYFTLFGSRPEVTEADGDRYLITAGLTLAAYVGAVVLAAVSRRRGLLVTAVVVGCLGLIVAFLVQVPSGRFIPDPAPEPDGPGGGSSCYGEGDPNCIGG